MIYRLDDAGRKEAKKYVEKWIKNAFKTKSQPVDIGAVTKAINGLYKSANLPPPRIVIVPSPMMARVVAGASAWIWYCNDTAIDATYAATYAATADATADATRAATADAYVATDYMIAIKKIAGEGAVRCAQLAWRMYQGGNMWSWWECLIDFGRNYLKLNLDYSKYDDWLYLAQNTGFRFMHEKFCIISDLPIKHVTQNNRLHNLSGAAIEWSDGFGIYAINGIQVPRYVIMHPELITAEKILKEPNTEVRRIMIERMGSDKFVSDANTQIVHEDVDQLGHPRRLLKVPMSDGDWFAIEVTDSSKTQNSNGDWVNKKYVLSVNPSHYNGRAGRECHAAIASTWRYGNNREKLFFQTPDDYKPLFET